MLPLFLMPLRSFVPRYPTNICWGFHFNRYTYLMYIRGIIYVMLLLHLSTLSSSQHQDWVEKPSIWGVDSIPLVKSKNVLSAFKSGVTQGHFRYFFSLTDNASTYADYTAQAVGGGLRFKTDDFYNFTFGLSGYYIFNIGSNGWRMPDGSTQSVNRYEIGLFDIEHPEQNEVSRLEELWIHYSLGTSVNITLGKQLINSPFINLQDGRMRPTIVNGAHIAWDVSPALQFQSMVVTGVSPRSTSRWFGVGESIGVYPIGVNPYGDKSPYKGNVLSSYIVNVEGNYKFNRQQKISFHNMWVHNVMQVYYAQYDAKYKTFYVGVQGLIQSILGEGGNAVEENRYYTNEKPVYTFGTTMGVYSNKIDVSVNTNRISSTGRFLMPREWGRDPFYTFLPRERNEGFGDVWAFNIKTKFTFHKVFSVMYALGYYELPEVDNFALNKYGQPSYMQSNLDIRLRPQSMFEGLEVQILYVYKGAVGETHESKKYIFNKVDMHHVNVVCNFRF